MDMVGFLRRLSRPRAGRIDWLMRLPIGRTSGLTGMVPLLEEFEVRETGLTHEAHWAAHCGDVPPVVREQPMDASGIAVPPPLLKLRSCPPGHALGPFFPRAFVSVEHRAVNHAVHALYPVHHLRHPEIHREGAKLVCVRARQTGFAANQSDSKQ